MKRLAPEDNERINKEVICETRKEFERCGHSVSKIAKELALICYSDPANHCDIAEGGELRFKTFDEQGDARRALQSLEEKTVITESKDGKELYKTSTVKWKLHDKLEALNLTSEIMSIKKPKEIKLNGNLDVRGAKQKLVTRINTVVKQRAKRANTKRAK